MQAEFTVIEPNIKLAYHAKAWTEGQNENGETMINQTTEVTFSEENGRTKVKVIATIYSTGPKAKMAAEGMQAGFTQQLEKLNDFLTAKQ